jgi:hypothetical protein
MLTWQASRLRGGRLEVTLPDTFDRSWRREGLEPKAVVPDVDAAGAWLMRTVGLVPVEHWLDRFETSLPRLLAACRGPRAHQILEAWTVGAILHDERRHFPALWDAWWERRAEPVRHPYLLVEMWSGLAHGMDGPALGERLSRMLGDPPQPEGTCGRVLDAVPSPWPDAAGEAFLWVVRGVVNELKAGKEPSRAWLSTFGPGARGIPGRQIVTALAVLREAATIDSSPEHWRRVLDASSEKLQIRQQLMEELNA